MQRFIFFSSNFLQKSELPITSFKKTTLPMHPTLENGSILTNRKNEKTRRLKPGPPSRQHLPGPHRCKYFQPGTEPEQEFIPWTKDTCAHILDLPSATLA